MSERDESSPTDGASLEEQVTALRAEVEQLKEERDKAVSSRDYLVREMLGGGTEGEPRPRGRVLVWAVALLLLLGIGLLMVQMFRTTGRVTQDLGGAPVRQPTLGLRSTLSPAQGLSPRRLVTLPVTELGLLNRAALAPDGKTLALGGGDGKLVIYDLKQDRVVRQAAAHRGEIRDLLFAQNGTRLYTAGADGAVHLWALTGKPTRTTLRAKGSPVRALALCGEQLVVAAEQPEIELITPGGGKPRLLRGHESWVRDVACTRNGRLLASGGHDGKIRLWTLPAGKLQRTLPGHKLWVSALAFSPNGRLLASGGFDRRVRLWDVARGKQLQVLRGHVRWISELAFHRTGRLLVSASVDRTAVVWRVDGKPMHRLEGHAHAVNSVGFYPGAKAVFTASSDGTVRFWPLPVPTPPAQAKLPPPRPGEVTLRRYTNGERMRLRIIDDAGNVPPGALKKLAWILRSGPDDRTLPPRPELVKLLYKVADHFGRQHEVWVISGFRSPEYNELRTRQSKQVGKESRHMKGEAMDIRIDGVTITAVHSYLLKLRAGGVGFYPDSQFIHMDIGPVRTWGGD